MRQHTACGQPSILVACEPTTACPPSGPRSHASGRAAHRRSDRDPNSPRSQRAHPSRCFPSATRRAVTDNDNRPAATAAGVFRRLILLLPDQARPCPDAAFLPATLRRWSRRGRRMVPLRSCTRIPVRPRLARGAIQSYLKRRRFARNRESPQIPICVITGQSARIGLVWRTNRDTNGGLAEMRVSSVHRSDDMLYRWCEILSTGPDAPSSALTCSSLEIG